MTNAPPDGYELLEELHDGRSSRVVRALRADDGRRVVVKTLKNADANPAERVRLRHENDMLALLSSPAVIAVHGLVRGANTEALVIEDFGALSLRSIAASARLDIGTILAFACQVAEGLEDIHAASILHKDINLSNIVVNVSEQRAKIIDFGISALFTREQARLQDPRSIEGTLQYIAPEQTGRINRPLDHRCDLYSFGISLYELLIGWPPFQSSDPMELVHSHIAELPAPPASLNRSIPGPLSAIVMRLIAKSPDDRYQTASGLRHDLERCREAWKSAGSIPEFETGAEDRTGDFRLPHALYGRDDEREKLMAAFERARQGRCSMVLVTGFAGSGKSSLVHEVQRPIVRHRARFIRGKFEQFRRNIPYAPLGHAFRELLRDILAGTEDELRLWRQIMLRELGPNAGVLFPIMPELELLVGEQPDLQPLQPIETENRLHAAFRNVTRVFASPQQPLVMFLDDLQWSDLASLKLLQSLLSSSGLSHLLVLGAYRDDEVKPTDPLMTMLGDVQRSGTPVEWLPVGPLTDGHVAELLSDALRMDAADTLPLARAVHAKTGGNPFFVGEFLTSLHRKGHLTHDAEQRRWTWDEAAVRGEAMTDNVVMFMEAKIRGLLAGTQHALTAAACIGNTFRLRTLADVLGQKRTDTAGLLWEAIREGLLVPLNEAHAYVRQVEEAGVPEADLPGSLAEAVYRFTHDRVRQAAYQLVPEGDRATLHGRIGRTLLAASDGDPTDEALFDVVHHLNQDPGRAATDAERIALVGMNLRAGRRASASTATDSARRFFAAGCGLLRAGDWGAHHTLSFDISLERANAEGLAAEFATAEELFEEMTDRVASDVDRARIHATKAGVYLYASRAQASLQASVEALRHLGIRLDPGVGSAGVAAQLLRSRLRLWRTGVDRLATLPRMTDERALVAMDVLMTLSRHSYEHSPQFHGLVITTMFNLTLRYGLAESSPFAFAVYGAIVAVGLRKYAEGHRLASIGLELAERTGNRQMSGRVAFTLGAVLNHWTRPIATNAEYLESALRWLGDSGDVVFTSFAHQHVVFGMLFRGEPLPHVLAKLDEYIDFARRAKFEDGMMALVHDRQMVLCLLGRTRAPGSFDSEDFNEEEHRNAFLSRCGPLRQGGFFMSKLRASALLGNAAEGMALAGALRPLYHTLAGQPIEAEYALYAGLSAASLDGATGSGPSEARSALRRHTRTLGLFARLNPPTFGPLYALLQAEQARIAGDVASAVRTFEQAASAAADAGFRQIHALALERSGRFHLGRGNTRVAFGFLAEAVDEYQRWGALAKVKALVAEFPALPVRTAQPPSSTTETGSSTTSTLDLSTVLRMSQALSSEIRLDRLLQRLTSMLLENAGADRGVVLLTKGDSFVVQAEGSVATREVTVMQSQPFDDGQAVPAAMVRFVGRTKEHVILDDAVTSGPFTDDPYILRARPRSVMCFPVSHQGKLAGIIYLENSLAAGTFTKDRLELLHLLSSQMATSIENARLYEEEKLLAQMQEEMKNAGRIQMDLLPKDPPALPGYQLSGRMIPAKSVGGDYFDFIEIGPGRVGICLGDVSGKGMPAALLMANLQATLRTQCRIDGTPQECLRRSNTLLYHSTSPEKFATVFYGVLDPASHTFAYCNAGQDPPFLLRGAAEPRRLERGGIPLAMFDEFAYEADAVEVLPGDVIVMYSDGISEAMNERKELLGDAAIRRILDGRGEATAEELIGMILEAVRAHAGTEPQSDDQTVVVMRRLR